MKLTGKCKEDFEKWFQEKSESHYRLVEWFEALDFNMQYGVYVDFFDIKGVITDIQPFINYDSNKYTDIDLFSVNITVLNEVMEDTFFGEYKTRKEARTAAIEKANELYNSKL